MNHFLLDSFRCRTPRRHDAYVFSGDASSSGDGNHGYPDDELQAFLYSIHRDDYDHDDDDSTIDGDDFMHEYMVEFTRSNYARLGLSMPKEYNNPFNME
jgi:hypothetical protein